MDFHHQTDDQTIALVDLDDAAQTLPVIPPVVSLVEDDDELQIVEETIRRPPLSAARLIHDDEIQVVDSTSAPSLTHVHNVALAPIPAVPTTCAACDNRLPLNYFEPSRCRHALCFACAVRCVAEPASQPFAPAHPHLPFVADRLKDIPLCVVPRCAAPLNRAEVDEALAPPEADVFFAACFEKFNAWRKEPLANFFGPSSINLQDFTPEMAAETLRHADSLGEGQLFDDDFVGACASLWLWDEVFQRPDGTLGSYMCAACGAYHFSHTAPTTAAPSDDAIPDHPPFPHCYLARAMGAVESVRKLTSVEQECDATPTSKPPTRQSTRRGRGRIKRYTTARAIQTAKRRRVNGFAKGTGYAGQAGGEWKGTSSVILARTARIDAARAFWLGRVRCFLRLPDDAAPHAWPAFMRALLRSVGLPEQLARVLYNESIMDVGERVPVYVAALRVVAALCEMPSLRRLVAEPSDGVAGRSLASLIDSLSKQAALLTTGVGNDNLPEKTKLLIKQIRRNIRAVNRHRLLDPAPAPSGPGSGARPEPPRAAGAPGAAAAAGGAADAPAAPAGDRAAAAEQDAQKLREQAYMAAMKPLQFQTVQGLAQASSFRGEIKKASASTVGRGAAIRRIGSEVSSLFASLPLSWSSTILLRVDEDRYDFLRACVFGPEDSPYECGAFLFDIFLPPTYPDVPPKFKLLTTGGNRVRFNPNLYANGKVCLSLLGTWSGPRWTPASTVLQVLVSIQSLILVDDPYFNEPGLEKRMGSAAGKLESARYSQRVRENTLHLAILDALRSPYNEFRTAIHTHFRLKRTAVERILLRWFAYPPPEGAEPAISGSSAATVAPAQHHAVVDTSALLQQAVNGFADISSTAAALEAMLAGSDAMMGGRAAQPSANSNHLVAKKVMAELDKLS